MGGRSLSFSTLSHLHSHISRVLWKHSFRAICATENMPEPYRQSHCWKCHANVKSGNRLLPLSRPTDSAYLCMILFLASWNTYFYSGTFFLVVIHFSHFFRTSCPPRGEISLHFWYLNNFQCLNCFPTCKLYCILCHLKWHLNPATLHSRSFHSLHFHLIYPPFSGFPALSSWCRFTCFWGA